MREIKFRAWDKEKNIWAKDDFLITSTGGICEYDEVRWTGGWHDITNYVLMQYSGLKDKNGKEIYEGDIVSCTRKVDEGGGWSSKQRIPRGKVYFDANWGVKIDDIYTKFNLTGEMWRDFYDVEIIGNIYENVDLLKV